MGSQRNGCYEMMIEDDDDEWSWVGFVRSLVEGKLIY